MIWPQKLCKVSVAWQITSPEVEVISSFDIIAWVTRVGVWWIANCLLSWFLVSVVSSISLVHGDETGEADIGAIYQLKEWNCFEKWGLEQ